MGTKCNMTWKGGTNWNFNIIFDKVLLVLLLIVLIQFLTGNEFRVSVVWHIARMNSHCGNGVSENIGTKVRFILLWHFRTLYAEIAEILKMKWNLEMTICFSLKSRPSERFHMPEMSQIKAEISLRTYVKLNFFIKM